MLNLFLSLLFLGTVNAQYYSPYYGYGNRFGVGSIVGVIIGGVVLLIVLFLLLCCMRRRRNNTMMIPPATMQQSQGFNAPNSQTTYPPQSYQEPYNNSAYGYGNTTYGQSYPPPNEPPPAFTQQNYAPPKY